MRGANRNKQPFWYALYAGVEKDYDEYGNQIGTHPTFGNPVLTSGNISPAKGEVVTQHFGNDALYDRVIVVGDRDTPINEDAVIWIGVTPQVDANGASVIDAQTGNYATPWNHIVRRVARSLPKFGNAIIAVDEVSVR